MRKLLGQAFLKAFGWTTSGAPPSNACYVMVAAPHTSNWDLPFMLAMSAAMGVPLRWMGKHTLFAFPFGTVMRALGGIPIERHKIKNVVEATADKLREAESLVVLVPPEATRGKADHWRSGFYHIAKAAQVPIVLGYLDYETRTGGLGPAIMPSDDVRADMDKIRAFYADKRGKFPDLFSTPRLKEEDAS
jgi:1-acyl-sn-glycerol-3-phosphate acyltransferase